MSTQAAGHEAPHGVEAQPQRCSICGGNKKPPHCHANGKQGRPCRNEAGAGTDHKGVGNCADHLGKTPSHEKAAARVIAAEKRQELTDRLVARLGEAPQITTGEAMQVSLDAMVETLAWFRDDVLPVVGTIDETGRATPMLEAMLRQVAELRDTARQAGALGVEERRIRVEEAQLDLVMTATLAAVTELGLDPAVARPVIARHVLAIDAASQPASQPSTSSSG